MIRIDDDELEFDGDLCLYQGQPFTGVGFEEGSKGTLLSEVEYKNGFPNGKTKRWYSSGQLKEEFSCKRGLRDGVSQSWFENGVIKVEAKYELGIELVYQEWSAEGELLESRELASGSVQEKILEQHRALYIDL